MIQNRILIIQHIIYVLVINNGLLIQWFRHLNVPNCTKTNPITKTLTLSYKNPNTISSSVCDTGVGLLHWSASVRTINSATFYCDIITQTQDQWCNFITIGY